MKKLLLSAFFAVFSTTTAFAYLPVSAVTSMTLPVYGIYVSSDPTCVTGMIATIPLRTTPQPINFVANPVIGTANSMPATIGCVVIVVQDNFSSAWAAGTYTGSSYTGGGGPFSDNIAACNNGGSATGTTICNSGVPTWPAQITADAAAIGLTLQTTNCTGATTASVVPLVLSTNSGCTGNTYGDSGVTACAGVNMNNYAMPTSVGDTLHGTRMSAPSSAGNLKFIVNPTNSFGATGAASCGNTSAPLFSFAAAD